MRNEDLFVEYVEILKREVKPALGCTEPIAVALAVAAATEQLMSKGEKPAKIRVEVSANILKNAMGVGIPGTSSQGLYVASALGAICGDASLGLEVLRGVNDEAVALADRWVEQGRIEIKLFKCTEKLYIKALCWSTHHDATATIVHEHDRFSEITLDQQIVHQQTPQGGTHAATSSALAQTQSIRSIYDFALQVPLQDISFIFDSVRLNESIAQEGFKKPYGLQVGRTLMNQNHRRFMGDATMTYAMALTAAAADARMGGCTLPAMSNSGSGNQGITVTLPVYAVGQKMEVPAEKLIRALALSHLVAIHIKQHLGKLSALCGCVIASSGAACGVVYLLGGGYQQVTYAIKNMIGNITGMVCDGAKAGCALKVSSGTSSAIQSAILACDDVCISSNDGIIEDCIESTILNLAHIGSVGMNSTDEIMLNIMLNKNHCP